MRLILLAALLLSPTQAADDLRGFPPGRTEAQRRLEERFRALPRPEHMREYVRRMSRQPHHAGSAGSRAVAEYALKLFQDWGLEARIETFEALLPYPAERRVEMLVPVQYRARLEEPALEEDPDTAVAGQLPSYNAYSGSGDVTAPLVYVNYGLPDDYRTLKELGIDVRGKIVLARYGQSWRGTKPKVAAENGAVGCLIYSDPRDDGYFQGDVYPLGPFRPPHGVQRGSVMDMPLYVGYPLTPGWASEPGARRLPADEARTLMRIPVQPISYADAQPLLAGLAGRVAPEPWRGALPLTYHLGPGPATVRLQVELDSNSRPVHDVVASIPGSVWPDEWIVWGNHHDAWVTGAADPATGAAAVLEAARAFGELKKSGWKPSRTLVFALWDAEEFGLVGSTEWVEKHREELKAKAVAYLNTDSTGRGRIGAGSSPLLERFFREVLRDARDPRSGRSLIEAAEQDRPLRFSALGAGSDYVAFVHQAGIASLNTGFGEDPGGVYHSIYDTFRWHARFSDGDFLNGRTLTEVMGVTVLRLSEAPVVPFEFGALAAAAGGWAEEIAKLAGQDAARMNLKPVSEALAGVREASAAYEAELARGVPAGEVAELNRILRGCERALTLEEGLPDRPWYKHQLYAPGLYTGYSAKTLPGIREAVEAGRWEQANLAARSVARALDRLRERIGQAARLAHGLER
ncbi:MAG: M28 family peptidase [Acidobacteria bacterium]|nr:M28 family peptidase [Acidobacteriota bacterium]